MTSSRTAMFDFPCYKFSIHISIITTTQFLTSCMYCRLYGGSYMIAHVLLNLLNELGKRDKM